MLNHSKKSNFKSQELTISVAVAKHSVSFTFLLWHAPVPLTTADFYCSLPPHRWQWILCFMGGENPFQTTSYDWSVTTWRQGEEVQLHAPLCACLWVEWIQRMQVELSPHWEGTQVVFFFF